MSNASQVSRYLGQRGFNTYLQAGTVKVMSRKRHVETVLHRPLFPYEDDQTVVLFLKGRESLDTVHEVWKTLLEHKQFKDCFNSALPYPHKSWSGKTALMDVPALVINHPV